MFTPRPRYSGRVRAAIQIFRVRSEIILVGGLVRALPPPPHVGYIREFGLWHIGEDDLLHGYRELSELAGYCKFRNCSHRNEPGCALITAAENGGIDEERLSNFYQIADTLDEEGRERYQ